MAGEFRIECKFCNKAMMVSYELQGKRVKCPHCKNPVPVPEVGGESAAKDSRENPQAKKGDPAKQAKKGDPAKQAKKGDPAKQAKKGDPAKQAEEVQVVQRKNQNKRPVHARKKIRVVDILKIVVFLCIAFGMYQGYLYYKASQKDATALLKEYADGKDSHKLLIFAKITAGKIGEKDVPVFDIYRSHSESRVRILVAESLGKIQTRNCLPTLQKLVDDAEKDVRRSAAAAHSGIHTNQAARQLIERLRKENDDAVKETIMDSLYDITGVQQIRGTDTNEYWLNQWWPENQNRKFEHDPDFK